MFPPTIAGRAVSFRSPKVSAVVVVLPLVPVMAMKSASMTRQPSSSSPMIGTPRALTGAKAGNESGTPGLTTTSSTSANAAAGCPPAHSRQPSSSSCLAAAGSDARGLESDASTRPPSLRTSRAAATPLRASPTTATVRPASHRWYVGPRSSDPLMSSSSSRAQIVATLSIVSSPRPRPTRAGPRQCSRPRRARAHLPSPSPLVEHAG